MLVNGVKQQPGVQKVSFKGIQQSKNDYGFETHDLFLPYDDKRYTATVEIVRVDKKDGKWFPDNKFAVLEIPMTEKDKEGNLVPSHKKIFNPASKFLDDQSFAYRFKLTDKQTGAETYHTDNGLRIGEHDPNKGQYVIVHRNRAPGKMSGVMIHTMADNFNPGYHMVNGKPVKIDNSDEIRKKLIKTNRTHFNNYGGNIAGMIEKIDDLKKAGYTRILSTPLFGCDEISSHGYWSTNIYQVTKKYGTLEDYKKLNVALFRKGMSLVADGAFVNEGMEGIHYKHALRWGDKSYAKNWIKGHGYKKPSIIPDVDFNTEAGKKTLSNLRLKVVNGNHSYTYTNGLININDSKRDKTQPTYVQVYDARLVSPEQVQNNELIRKNGKLSTDNHFDIAMHNDSVLPFAFEVPEDEIASFEKRIAKYQGKLKDNKDNKHLDFLETVLQFPNFEIGRKAPGNTNNWDGNADVFKLNFTYTNKDEQDLTIQGATAEEKEAYEQATWQVQSYALGAGPYWTRVVRNADVEDAAKTLSKAPATVDGYKSAFQKEGIPDTAKDAISDKSIENVLADKYYISQLEATSIPSERLLEDVMSYPLEAIEFSPDLQGVLGSPYLSKKAHSKEDLSTSRNEFFQANDYTDPKLPKEFCDVYYDMDQLYSNQFLGIASRAIETADKEGNLGLFDSKKQLSDKGKLVFPLIADDVARFLVVKALAPEVKVENNNGELKYDYDALRKVGIKSLGIAAQTPGEEAQQVFNRLNSGLSNLSDPDKKVLSDSIKDRFKDVTTNGLKMAYVVVDKTESGLNWRTDATKDQIEIDNIRNGLDKFGTQWDKSIDFWKTFVGGIRKENPNALVITEMTDLENNSIAGKGSGRFHNDMDATIKFVEETGATTTSNYALFSNLQRVFARDAEGGYAASEEDGKNVPYNMIPSVARATSGQNNWGGKNPGSVNTTGADGSRHSHIFLGNHDKPRLLHVLALDMAMFHNHPDAKDDIAAAANKYAKPVLDEGLFPDTKALAMAKMIDTHMMPHVADEKTKKALHAAICDLASGSFKDEKFNAEHFGAEEPEFAIRDVIEQAKYKNKDLNVDAEDLTDKTRESALKTAMEVALIAKKFLMIMPGDYTEYSGDSLGMGGYEAACKNIHVQNRNIIPWEYLKDDKKGYVQKFYDEHTELNKLRADKELSALSTGETHRLDAKDDRIFAAFRYNADSEVLILAHDKFVEKSRVEGKSEVRVKKNDDEYIDQIDVDPQQTENGKNATVIAGLAGGLAVGTSFKDVSSKNIGSQVIGVCESAGKYFLKQFGSTDLYNNYVTCHTNKTGYDFKPEHKIKLTDHVMVLKKIPFKGRTPQHNNPNYFKIQAYLNSKTHLNAEPKYTSIAK